MKQIDLLSALARDCKNGDDILTADHIARELSDVVADFSKHLIRAGTSVVNMRMRSLSNIWEST